MALPKLETPTYELILPSTEEKGLGPKADLPGYSSVMRIGNDTVYRRT